MKYVKLGNSGLEVSPICLGCMSFGEVTRGFHQWVLDKKSSAFLIRKALDSGINFFDTANCYSNGTSEEFLGWALKEYAQRDEVVVATKVGIPLKPGPNKGGLSRKAILVEIDDSLTRLGLDYVDLYIIHRWDDHTPIEETMETLHDLVKAGKVRYLGASKMDAWQFEKAQYVAEKHNFTKFVSMQNHYNLIFREDEREMIPLCIDQKVASTPYSPLAGGRLARNWEANTLRYQTDQAARIKYDGSRASDIKIVERVGELSQKYKVPPAQIALAWLFAKEPVVSPVIGATKTSHIDDAVDSLGIKLMDAEIAYLEEPYLPHETDLLERSQIMKKD